MLRKAVAAVERGAGDENADCCSIPESFRIFPAAWTSSGERSSTPDIEFEDQNGSLLAFDDFFTTKPSIVVFFYTRCDNPNKCSLTITKLGRLQKALAEQGLAGKIRTAAITYDPGFDLARRLKIYAEARGVLTDTENKVLRAPAGLKELRAYFELGVNFINSIVNRHRIELFILDKNGRVAFTFARLQWEVQEVVDHAGLVLEKSEAEAETEQMAPVSGNPGPVRLAYEWVASFLVPLAVVFFPKCPICWMAYLSLFGITGLQGIPYSPWLLPFFVILMLVNLFSIYRRGKHNGAFAPFYLSLLGVLLILVPGMWLEIVFSSYLGVGFLFIGSVMSVLSFRKGPAMNYLPQPNGKVGEV
jgi:protein SCO1/2